VCSGYFEICEVFNNVRTKGMVYTIAIRDCNAIKRVMLTNKFTSPIDGCAEGGSFGLFRQGCLVILHRSRDATTNSVACKQVYKSSRCCAEGGSFGLFRQGCLGILVRSRDAMTNA